MLGTPLRRHAIFGRRLMLVTPDSNPFGPAHHYHHHHHHLGFSYLRSYAMPAQKKKQSVGPKTKLAVNKNKKKLKDAAMRKAAFFNGNPLDQDGVASSATTMFRSTLFTPDDSILANRVARDTCPRQTYQRFVIQQAARWYAESRQEQAWLQERALLTVQHAALQLLQQVNSRWHVAALAPNYALPPLQRRHMTSTLPFKPVYPEVQFV